MIPMYYGREGKRRKIEIWDCTRNVVIKERLYKGKLVAKLVKLLLQRSLLSLRLSNVLLDLIDGSITSGKDHNCPGLSLGNSGALQE